MNPQLYAIVAMVLLLASGVYSYEKKINTLKSELLTTENKLLQSTINNSKCEDSLSNQNALIVSQKADYDTKLKEFRETPPKIRYEVIYKTTKEVKSNECNDTKQVINNIRNLDFDRL